MVPDDDGKVIKSFSKDMSLADAFKSLFENGVDAIYIFELNILYKKWECLRFGQMGFESLVSMFGSVWMFLEGDDFWMSSGFTSKVL